MGNSIDDFLNHRGSGGRQSKMLKGWKTAGMTRLWLHTKVLPAPLWVHKFLRVVVFEDKGTRQSTHNVWQDLMVCHESEATAKQWIDFVREREEFAPPIEHCAMCRFQHTVRKLVLAGKLDPVAPIFRFEADDPKDTRVLHAGGFGGT